MTDDLQERAREVLAAHIRPMNKGASWNILEAKDDGYWLPIIEAMLAFASPTPEPSGAVVEARALVARVVEGDSDNPLRVAEANAIYAGERDDTEAVKAALASLDAGSASS